eukprot:gene8173-biopygen19614
MPAPRPVTPGHDGATGAKPPPGSGTIPGSAWVAHRAVRIGAPFRPVTVEPTVGGVAWSVRAAATRSGPVIPGQTAVTYTTDRIQMEQENVREYELQRKAIG